MSKIEGYWYSKYSPEYPMPVPNALTEEEANEIYRLIKRKETSAAVTRYRGISTSRIDKKTAVGSMEYKRAGWVWPQGFAEHYVLKHKVKPSMEFLDFIGYKRL